LKLSTYPFSQGLAFWMYSVRTHALASHSWISLATNSGPLSLRRCSGAPRTANRYWSVMITSRAVNDRATSIARHSLVNSSITTRIRNCLPSSVRSVRKS
jgi:hypothetical protein